MSANPDLRETEGGIFMSSERQTVALEAACEIEQLCHMLQAGMDPENERCRLAVRGVSKRIQELSGVVISAVQDTLEQTADLAETVGC